MRILVCLSAVEHKNDVVSFACRIAVESASEITLLHVNPRMWSHSKGYVEEREQAKLQETLKELPEHMKQFIEEPTRLLEEAGVTVSALVLESNRPARCIIRVADEEDVDLIVCGATQHGGVEQIFQPSITSYLLKHSRRPVLVVPHRQ